MTHAAAQEVREEGIHVALLIVDATIESPKTADFTRDTPKNALADMRLIAEAVEYLAAQQPRAYTHELMLTPAGDRWVPSAMLLSRRLGDALARPRGLLALDRIEHELAQADHLGRDLHALVLADELERLVERELVVGDELHGFL